MIVDNNSKIYFQVYKKIEDEVIKLSSSIYFSDDQLGVYSIDIADLITRCVIEIESIVKDIYRMKNGKEPNSPGQCIRWIEDNWKISKKVVTIVAASFHLETMLQFAPFNYKNGFPEDYYSSYNAIKHDRVKNLKKATVYTLIRALGALYVLNIYYVGRKIQLSGDRHAEKIDKTGGSQIFVFSIAPCVDEIILSSEENIIPETCIYKIVRRESEYSFKVHYINTLKEHRVASILMVNKAFQEYAVKLRG